MEGTLAGDGGFGGRAAVVVAVAFKVSRSTIRSSFLRSYLASLLHQPG